MRFTKKPLRNYAMSSRVHEPLVFVHNLHLFRCVGERVVGWVVGGLCGCVLR